MNIEKSIPVILLILAIAGLIWSATMFFSGSGDDSAKTINTPENYSNAMRAELQNKCETPPDYTDEEWRQHMSHHPDQYKECLAEK